MPMNTNQASDSLWLPRSKRKLTKNTPKKAFASTKSQPQTSFHELGFQSPSEDSTSLQQSQDKRSEGEISDILISSKKFSLDSAMILPRCSPRFRAEKNQRPTSPRSLTQDANSSKKEAIKRKRQRKKEDAGKKQNQRFRCPCGKQLKTISGTRRHIMRFHTNKSSITIQVKKTEEKGNKFVHYVDFLDKKLSIRLKKSTLTEYQSSIKETSSEDESNPLEKDHVQVKVKNPENQRAVSKKGQSCWENDMQKLSKSHPNVNIKTEDACPQFMNMETIQQLSNAYRDLIAKKIQDDQAYSEKIKNLLIENIQLYRQNLMYRKEQHHFKNNLHIQPTPVKLSPIVFQSVTNNIESPSQQQGVDRNQKECKVQDIYANSNQKDPSFAHLSSFQMSNHEPEEKQQVLKKDSKIKQSPSMSIPRQPEICVPKNEHKSAPTQSPGPQIQKKYQNDEVIKKKFFGIQQQPAYHKKSPWYEDRAPWSHSKCYQNISKQSEEFNAWKLQEKRRKRREKKQRNKKRKMGQSPEETQTRKQKSPKFSSESEIEY